MGYVLRKLLFPLSFVVLGTFFAYDCWSRNITIHNHTPYDLQVNIEFIAAEDIGFDHRDATVAGGETKVIVGGGDVALMKRISARTVQSIMFRPKSHVVVESIGFGKAVVDFLGGQKQLHVDTNMRIRMGKEGLYYNDVHPNEQLDASIIHGTADYGLGQSIFNKFTIHLDYVARGDGQFDEQLVIHRFL